MNAKIKKITPNLWFESEAEEAAKFYTSIFHHSKMGRITRYGEVPHDNGSSEGKVMTVEFELEGQNFVALNGGPQYKFTEAVSFIVHCETQDELDYFWEKLSEGGDEKAQVCGWLKDKFGLSWQVIPANLTEMMTDPDARKAERVLKALLQMKKKIDMETLKQVFEAD